MEPYVDDDDNIKFEKNEFMYDIDELEGPIHMPEDGSDEGGCIYVIDIFDDDREDYIKQELDAIKSEMLDFDVDLQTLTPRLLSTVEQYS
ncbi:hypothetical protein FSST1_011779 [Fusarium sambucinum]